MKSIILLLMAVALAGCTNRTTDVAVGADPYDPVVYRDRLTGCEYLSTGEFKGITPRLREDGKQICHPR